MRIIQLDIFSPLYYSTLGYDEELIDYLSFIEDQQIPKLFPQPVQEGNVPSHSALSRFRKQLGQVKNEKLFNELQRLFVNQANK